MFTITYITLAFLLFLDSGSLERDTVRQGRHGAKGPGWYQTRTTAAQTQHVTLGKLKWTL